MESASQSRLNTARARRAFLLAMTKLIDAHLTHHHTAGLAFETRRKAFRTKKLML
jgi:hypothetical protein